MNLKLHKDFTILSTLVVYKKKKLLILKKNTNLLNIYFFLSQEVKLKILTENIILNSTHNLYNTITKLKNVLEFGIKKKILLLGLGYNAYSKNNLINFKIGFSHNILLNLPVKQLSLSIYKCRRKNINIILTGNQYSTLCDLSNKIINLKKPNAYKEIGFFNKTSIRKVKTFKKK